ncbi:EamA family transporter RarD [Edwardsiella tarda]|uniref:EamA family transporter RarD n=1 Tax=Edwardsiella tarda TaxID=636 RepID=UPI001967387A|nr:EamA family transporter RarD [Edwardsiella tarda]
MWLTNGPLLAVLSFILWGITPLYYKLLNDANAFELLAQRLFWSVPLLLALRLLFKQRTTWRAVWQDKRSLYCCLLGGAIMSVSWTTFIYALTHNLVLDASLGYFTNPLFAIALGVIFLHDRLTPFQRLAVLLAIIGLGYQIILLGRVPVLALVMGITFAFYGLVRKYIRYDIMTSLTLETLWMLPLAIGITFWLQLNGESGLTGVSSTHYLLYILTAPVTYAPLLLFAAAIKRTSLTVVGLAQYVEPSLQFLLAVLLFGEPINVAKMVSFSLIWLGLALCIYEIFIIMRRPDPSTSPAASPAKAGARLPVGHHKR